MSELVHADIFFFITAVAVMLLTTILAVALVYGVLIVRDVRVIISRIRRASESLESDLNALRNEVKYEGLKARALVDLVLGFVSRKVVKAVKPKRAAKVKDESAAEDTEEN